MKNRLKSSHTNHIRKWSEMDSSLPDVTQALTYSSLKAHTGYYNNNNNNICSRFFEHWAWLWQDRSRPYDLLLIMGDIDLYKTHPSRAAFVLLEKQICHNNIIQVQLLVQHGITFTISCILGYSYFELWISTFQCYSNLFLDIGKQFNRNSTRLLLGDHHNRDINRKVAIIGTKKSLLWIKKIWSISVYVYNVCFFFNYQHIVDWVLCCDDFLNPVLMDFFWWTNYCIKLANI